MFVAERFEQLRDLLLEFGYALDPGERDPNEWHELHYEDPPTGVVWLKASDCGISRTTTATRVAAAKAS